MQTEEKKRTKSVIYIGFKCSICVVCGDVTLQWHFLDQTGWQIMDIF